MPNPAIHYRDSHGVGHSSVSSNPRAAVGDSTAVELDDEVLQRLQRGDASALAEVFALYGDRIFNTCRRLTGSHADAEDATQEVFLRVLDKAPTFTGQSRFSTWLFRVAVNHTINFCRRRQRRELRPLDEFTEPVATADDRTNPLASVLDLEARRELDQALQHLPEDQRSIVILREIEGLSYAEIAEIVELPTGTVTSRLVRGRQRLQQILRLRLTTNDPP